MSASLDLLNYCGLHQHSSSSTSSASDKDSCVRAAPGRHRCGRRIVRSLKKVFKPNDKLAAGMNGNSPPAEAAQRPEAPAAKPQVYVVGSPNPKSPFLRIAHISDTCDAHDSGHSAIFNADVLVHSGNICSYQFRKHFFKDSEFHNQVKAINDFFARLPHRHKIFVPGPNEIFFDSESREHMQALLPNCIYLQDASCVIDGVKFYGIPWSASRRGAVGRGFGKSSSELRTVWSNVPDDVDVLISHSMPPSNALYEELVARLRPKMFLYGSRQQRSSRTDQAEENCVKFKDNVIFSNGHAGNACRRGIFDFYSEDSGQRVTQLPTVSPQSVAEAYRSHPPASAGASPRSLLRCVLS